MGIPLDVYTLHRLEGTEGGCAHPLLLRVRQAEYGNADAGAYDHVVRAADARRDALIRRYDSTVLARECGRPHRARLIGELQAHPAGGLAERTGGGEVELWLAQTRYGPPWVVLGTAQGEAAFWRAVRQDDDLAALGPVEPAETLRAYYLADEAG